MAILLKPGVQLDWLAPGGWWLFQGLQRTSSVMGIDLTITCGRDGHPADDPHTLGNALDVRTHDLDEPIKQQLVLVWMKSCQLSAADAPIQVSGGLATARFWAWLEHPGLITEHCHAQLRKMATFGMADYLNT